MKKYQKPSVRCAELISCAAMLTGSNASLGLGGSNRDNGAPDRAEAGGLRGYWDEEWEDE